MQLSKMAKDNEQQRQWWVIPEGVIPVDYKKLQESFEYFLARAGFYCNNRRQIYGGNKLGGVVNGINGLCVGSLGCSNESWHTPAVHLEYEPTNPEQIKEALKLVAILEANGILYTEKPPREDVLANFRELSEEVIHELERSSNELCLKKTGDNE